jgi:dihydroorotate dehydrogenase
VNIFVKILNLLPPENAHKVAIFCLKYGFFPNFCNFSSNILKNKVFGIQFQNPVGLSAGFDKNADCLNNLYKFGFGFLELGTVTLKPQIGNKKPRIFRLKEDHAIINRLGFNNKGIEYLRKNIILFNKRNIKIPIGINIGKGKETKDPIEDYLKLFEKVSKICSYVALNISSPNTIGLRDLQKSDILTDLVKKVQDINKNKIPLLIKISPDINDEEKADIVDIAIKYKISGMILTNTTIHCRNGLQNSNSIEKGGLSGRPLFNLSTKILSEVYQHSNGKINLIGCGGISNAQEAYMKIKNGASLIQLYTALIYQGFGLVNKINQELERMLISDGFKNIKQAVGSIF